MTTSMSDLAIRPNRELQHIQTGPCRGIADPARASVPLIWLRPTMTTAFIATASIIGFTIAARLECLPPFSVAHVVVLSLAIAAMHAWLTQALGVPWTVSIPASVLYLAHPLLRQIVINDNEGVGRLVLVLLPLIGLCATWSASQGRMSARLMLGGLVGVTSVLQPTGAWLLIGSTVVWAVLKQNEHRSIASAVRDIVKDVVLIGITAGSTMLVTQLAINRWDIGIVPTLSQPLAEVTPFALVDRVGWLSSRLASIPVINSSNGGVWYIGWSSVLLALAGTVVVRPLHARQRIGSLLALVMLVLWCGVGPESLHSQLREMFEFVTIKRHVDPMSLHLVGLLMLPIMIVAALLFRAITNIVGPSRQHSSFTVVVLATCTVLFWWTTSPAILPTGLDVSARAIWFSALPPALLAFAISSSAAVGFTHLLLRCSKLPYACAVWMMILGMSWIDLSRGATSISPSSLDARPPSASQPSSPTK